MKAKRTVKRAKPRKRHGHWAVTGFGHITTCFGSDKDLLAYLRYNTGCIVSWIRAPQSHLKERQ